MVCCRRKGVERCSGKGAVMQRGDREARESSMIQCLRKRDTAAKDKSCRSRGWCWRVRLGTEAYGGLNVVCSRLKGRRVLFWKRRRDAARRQSSTRKLDDTMSSETRHSGPGRIVRTQRVGRARPTRRLNVVCSRRKRVEQLFWRRRRDAARHDTMSSETRHSGQGRILPSHGTLQARPTRCWGVWTSKLVCCRRKGVEYCSGEGRRDGLGGDRCLNDGPPSSVARGCCPRAAVRSG